MRAPGLRLRIALLAAGLASTAIAAAALYSGHVASRVLRRQLGAPDPADVRQAAAILTRRWSRERKWRGAQPVLDGEAHRLERQLVLLDSAGGIAAASPRSLLARGLSIGADGSLTWRGPAMVTPADRDDSTTRIVRVRRVTSAAPPAVSLVAPDGHRIGTLLVLPPLPDLLAGDEPLALAPLRRALAVGVSLAVAAAVLASLFFSARLARPIEELTRRVRAVALAGPLAARSEPPARRASGEVGELAAAFERMLDALTRTEETRRRLTADIAHELRAPVTNIRCQVEAMEDGLQPADAGALASLHEETMILQRLIEDLQDIALAESDALPLRRERVAPAAELAAVARAFEPRAEHAGIRLVTALAPDLPAIDADVQRLRQVVGNLLSNALAHSAPGSTVELSASGAAGPSVRIRVRDEGSGIAAEDLPHVFERFYRADRSRSRVHGGAGLGLSIVRHLVALHGGTVAVASTPGVGSTFTVELPAR